MKRLTEKDLVLHYYGDSQDPETVQGHLAESPEDQARFEALCRVLDAVKPPEVPESPEHLPAVVWARLQQELEEVVPQRRSWTLGTRWATAGLMAGLLLVAFLAGRFSPRTHEGSAEVSGERILLVALAGHLERSEMFLLELSNAEGNGGIDLGAELVRARELADQNRLFRQAASAAGQDDLTAFLDDLERMLVELSHSPSQLAAQDLDELHGRLDELDLLFKVRVVVDRLNREAGEDKNNSVPRHEV